MKREDGFYWVKYEGEWMVGQWANAVPWNREGWGIAFCEEDLKDSEFQEIDETKIVKPQ